MNLAHVLLILFWIVYCLLHSLFAAIWFKTWAFAKMKGQYKFYRKLYVIFAAITFIGIVFYQFTMDQVELFDPPQFLRIIAIVIGGIAGLIIILYILRYFRTFLNEPMAIHGTPKPLVTNGAYKYVRHPLYIVTFVFIWSAFILLPWLSSLICNVIVTGYTIWAIPLEEKKLEMEYGDAYAEYKKKIPMLFPRIWRGSQFRGNGDHGGTETRF